MEAKEEDFRRAMEVKWTRRAGGSGMGQDAPGQDQ